MEELKENGPTETQISSIVKLQQVKVVWSDGRSGLFTGPAVFKTREEMVTCGARLTDVTFSQPYDYNIEKNEVIENGDATSVSSASREKDMEVVEGEKGMSEKSDGMLCVQDSIPATTEDIDKKEAEPVRGNVEGRTFDSTGRDANV
jgi:hypothetical protein